MMFLLRRLLLLLVIGVAVYCFWPRTASMSGFDPEEMSDLQIAVWKAAAEKKLQAPIGPLFRIYHLQYHLPPVASLKMAFDTARALHLFQTSPDAADQEKALLPLQTVFVTLKSDTKSSFESSAAARMEFTIWTLRADGAKRAQLTSAWAESLALLYGHSSQECLSAAKQFSIASKLADEGKWGEARTNALEAWKAIKALAPAGK